jgi:hypothetical protein
MSRKLNAREADREVAQDTLNKLGQGVKPEFSPLSSTIQYVKQRGFQEFSNGMRYIPPEKDSADRRDHTAVVDARNGNLY